MKKILSVLIAFLALSMLTEGQSSPMKAATPEPRIPVIDYGACPFEGCTFEKWLVTRDDTLLSTWKNGGKPITTVHKGEVVVGLTGVHVTYEPDRIQVTESIPELHLQSGDIILRYMYHGEGFADFWAKGQWKKDQQWDFITEEDHSGCLRDCSAKVIEGGRKVWWVRVKTSKGSIGWTKANGQFDCIDAFGGDDACDNLNRNK